MSTSLQPLSFVQSALMDTRIINMDPQLQKAVAFHRNGIHKMATSSTAEDEVAVLAKVSDVQQWLDMTEVKAPAAMGDPDEDGESIVTGRIPIKLIEKIRVLPFVKSLKGARKISPALYATIEDVEAGTLLPPAIRSKGGKGCIVGIIDFGCDFAHQNFLKPDNKTRIRKLWDQWSSRFTPGVAYGEVFTEANINAALGKVNPYLTLGYEPERQSHGTHVMDIAAGNGRGSGYPGLAHEADIIFVELAGSDVAWEGQEVVGSNFGDSVQLLEAMAFIFREAGDKPCVINASLGTNGGPHDGTSLVEQGIDRLVKQKPNRAVVIAAANSYADNIHAAGSINAGATYDLSWYVPGNDNTENEIEIWYNKDARLEVELIDPSGISLGMVPPNESGTIRDTNDRVRIFLANRLDEPNNHDNMIGVYMNRRNQGTWIMRLKNISSVNADFHAWIERDDRGQSSFPEPADNSHTLGSLSCGRYSIVVGSYDAHRANRPLSYFSSSGPTRDGRNKPEVSAPGHEVRAANSLSRNGVTVKSGTSMAAPAVAGALAVFLSEAKARKISLNVEEIRDYLKKGSRATGAAAWDQRYGFGRISLKKMMEALPKVPARKTAKKPAKKSAKPKVAPPKRKSSRPQGIPVKSKSAAKRKKTGTS